MPLRRSEDTLAGAHGEISFGLEKEQLILKDRAEEKRLSVGMDK